MHTAKKDHYQLITSRIVEQLETGVRPWHQPWNAKHAAGSITRPLRFNGQKYHGINVVVLWLSGLEGGFSCPIWMTFQQAKELGAFVKKGQKGTTVVYANQIEKSETDPETGEETTQRIPFLKSYTVFNVDQIEGLPAHYYAREKQETNDQDRLNHVEEFFRQTQATVQHGGERAFYHPRADYIQLPEYATFDNRERYYSTFAHEAVHWTGHERRLNRQLDKNRFGDAAYSIEELIAELGAAFLCADLQITPEVMPEHASYLQSWLRVLKDDTRAIFTAAAQAEKAVDFLHQLQPSAE
ncbi:MAG: zincin-like metallopeptidase domain-containing protein [Zavarzinella sp.]